MKPGLVGVAIFVIAVLVVAGYALFGQFGTARDRTGDDAGGRDADAR